MVSFPHVVTAPPERVYDTICNPSARTRHQKFFQVAAAERGKAGEKGLVARYETKLWGKWREQLVETERPMRVVFEERGLAAEGKGAKANATMEWRLAPINLGTHLVLEVKGSNLWTAFVARYVKRYRYRRLVRAVKKAVEGPPESIVPDFPTIEEWRKRREAAGEGEAQKAPTKGKAKPEATEEPAATAAPPKRLKTVSKEKPAGPEAPVAPTPSKPKRGKRAKKR